MKVINLDSVDAKLYEQFLLEDEGNMIYASLKYKGFLEKILECTSNYMVAVQGNKIEGVLPLMIKNGKYGKVINSLPFYGSHGGVISRNEEAIKVLSDFYNQFIDDENVLASNMVENPLMPNGAQQNVLHNEQDVRISQITPLNIPIESSYKESLIMSFHYKTRNMIRKAIKNSVVSAVDNDAFDFLEEVHIENMNAISGKPKSSAFFNEIKTFFVKDKDYRIYTATKDGEVIAALLLLYYNKTVEYFTPVIKAEFRSLQPMSVLIYDAMVDAFSNGYENWNWGGTWGTQEGVYRFKNRWNTKNLEYKYYVQINDQKVFNLPKEGLLSEYSDFYVVPFSKLKN